MPCSASLFLGLVGTYWADCRRASAPEVVQLVLALFSLRFAFVVPIGGYSLPSLWRLFPAPLSRSGSGCASDKHPRPSTPQVQLLPAGGSCWPLAQFMGASPEPETVLRGHAAEVTAASFSHARDASGLPLLYTAGGDGELRLWSVRTRRTLAAVPAHTASVLAVQALAADRVLSQGRDGYVRIWDAQVSTFMAVSRK